MHLQNLDIKTRLNIVLAVFFLGFFGFLLFVRDTFDKIKIGGPFYQKIILGKDFISEVLPPSQNLDGAYLNACRLQLTNDDREKTRLLEEADLLRDQYAASREKWMKKIAFEGIKKTLEDAHRIAEEFFRARDEDFLPALRRGDRSRAETLLKGPLLGRYLKHQEIVLKIIDSLEEWNKSNEKKADRFIRGRIFHRYVIVILISVVILTVNLSIRRSILKPLEKTVETLFMVGGGDLTRRVNPSSKDEIADMGRNLDNALDVIQSLVKIIAQSCESLTKASGNLSGVSHNLSSSAEETSAQGTVVSAAAHQVSKSLQVIQTETDGMSASIREVADNVNKAVDVASRAVERAENTNAVVRRLGVSSSEIENIAKVISDIAAQTNLLALNATIEAARAGEAGKGFAVVANEVKDLAKGTSKATEDIGHRINAIRDDVKQTVDAIRRVAEIINEISAFQNSIAAAVNEQDATTKVIARNIGEAVNGSMEIARNISQVAAAAGQTTDGAGNVMTSAGDLSRMASELQHLVMRFKY